MLFDKSEFAVAKTPTSRRKHLMHVYDAGPAFDDLHHMVKMRCDKCELMTEWYAVRTVTEAKQGIQCPKCNHIEYTVNEYDEFEVPESYR